MLFSHIIPQNLVDGNATRGGEKSDMKMQPEKY